MGETNINTVWHIWATLVTASAASDSFPEQKQASTKSQQSQVSRSLSENKDLLLAFFSLSARWVMIGESPTGGSKGQTISRIQEEK